MNNASLKALLLVRAKQIEAIEKECDAAVIGRKVRITSDYNGQPYGRSARSRKGEVHEVTSCVVSGNGVHLFLKAFQYGHPCIDISEVEFIDP